MTYTRRPLLPTEKLALHTALLFLLLALIFLKIFWIYLTYSGFIISAITGIIIFAGIIGTTFFITKFTPKTTLIPGNPWNVHAHRRISFTPFDISALKYHSFWGFFPRFEIITDKNRFSLPAKIDSLSLLINEMSTHLPKETIAQLHRIHEQAKNIHLKQMHTATILNHCLEIVFLFSLFTALLVWELQWFFVIAWIGFSLAIPLFWFFIYSVLLHVCVRQKSIFNAVTYWWGILGILIYFLYGISFHNYIKDAFL